MAYKKYNPHDGNGINPEPKRKKTNASELSPQGKAQVRNMLYEKSMTRANERYKKGQLSDSQLKQRVQKLKTAYGK